jgi:hypothetical protein
MCTASWIHEGTGYQVFFNRDEKLTRKKAMPPDFAARDGIRFLAPVDGDFGGTWIATNEFGVSACLLNGAGNQCNVRSRGLLIPELISAPSVSVICERVRAADFAVFAPFTIAALGPGQPGALIDWDGSRKTVRFHDEPCFMLTSSSFDTEAVRASRQSEFRGVVDAEFLTRFHGSHVPARGAYSTCMHRPDAETVSFSRIHVSERDTDFFYSPAAPCAGIPGVCLKLTRRGRLNDT